MTVASFYPFVFRAVRILNVYPGGIALPQLIGFSYIGLLRQQPGRHQRVDGFTAVDDRPSALGPFHGSQTGLAPHVVIASAHVAVGQKHNPPRSVLSLHEVAVTRALNLLQLSFLVAVGQDGIGGIRLVGPIRQTYKIIT